MRTRPVRRSLVSVYVFLTLFAVYSLFPVVWTIVTSFKPPAEAVQYPPRVLPSQLTLENYAYVIARTPVPTYIANTFIVSGATVAIVVAASALAGYAFSRFSFPGSQILLFSLLVCVMVSGATKVIPLYLMLLQWGLLNNHWGLILTYSAELVPLAVWLMKSFIDTIPTELDDAMLMDGGGRMRVFFSAILPLSPPALVAVALMTFIRASQEFIYASVFIPEPTLKTAPVGVYIFFTEIGVQWTYLSAAALLIVAPIILIFLLLERSFSSGLTVGAVK